MPKKDNPPFFVYLTRAQKVEYQNDRIEPNIKKALYMFADPLKPTTFLTLTNDISLGGDARKICMVILNLGAPKLP